MFFANARRDQVKQENEGITFGQVGKMLGAEWRALDATERLPYEAKAAADKKRYEEEKEQYRVSDERDDADLFWVVYIL